MNNIVDTFSHLISSGSFSYLVFILAFAGGVISSLSPCSVGILPIVVGYIGSSENTVKRNIVQVTFFVIGLALVLTTIGVICTLTGKVFGSFSSPIWILLISSFILVMGLNQVEFLHVPMPTLIKKMPKNTSNNLILYPLLIGAAFALAASPCSTPILAGIMAYASADGHVTTGALMLFLFALGQGVIFVIAALFTSFFKKSLAYNRASDYIVKFSGVILVLTSLFLYYKVFSAI